MHQHAMFSDLFCLFLFDIFDFWATYIFFLHLWIVFFWFVSSIHALHYHGIYFFLNYKGGGGGLLCKVSAAVQSYTIHALIIKYIDFASNIYTDWQIIKFLNPRLVFIRKNLLFATKFGNTCTVQKNSSVFYASAHMYTIS